MLKGYYFITDAALSRAGNTSDVKNALAAGAKVVQYRNKSADTKQMYEEALELRSICKKAIFLINDRVDIVKAIDADGVHLGSEDLPYRVARKLLGKNKIIGLTVHSMEEAWQAERLGADYIGVSPVFATATKLDAGRPAGLSLIKEIKKYIKIPLIAIGGINLSNARQVIAAGADGLCAISAVVTKPDVKKEIEKFQSLFLRIPMPWHIYIIQCKDATLYTGITKNLTRRIKAHNSGNGCRFTKYRIPVELLYSERVRTRSSALRRETEIKSFTRKRKLELIYGK
jgi:thiamine-phosphate pyrophosphorylase